MEGFVAVSARARIYPESKVEVRGLTARFYDRLMDVITLGRYGRFIRRAVDLMEIEPDDNILDMGVGSGRNARLMAKHLGKEGSLLGLDISEELGRSFRKRCAAFPNVGWELGRVDVPLDYDGKFDKVFIAFVLHGFPHEVREVVIENARRALRKGGDFFILDYATFDLKRAPFYLRTGFRLVECPYAFDFIEKNWSAILADHGMEARIVETFFSGCVQLLAGRRG